MEIHYWWVGLACLLMVLSKGAHAASVEPTQPVQEHGFDLGRLRCCPKPRDSDVCPDMISDFIPCTIANDMERRENRIRQTLASQSPLLFEPNCTRSIREVLCEQNFPTCVINSDDSHEVEVPARSTCEEKLKEVCEIYRNNPRAIEEMCSLYEPTSTNYSVGNCSVVNVTLNHCTIDWYLPAWLLQYVKQIDVELDNALSDQFITTSHPCWEKIRDVRCKSVGRCWALGDRLEHIISLETCNETVSW